MTIHWRLITLVALTWLFIYAGAGWVERLAHRATPCSPLQPITCEP